MRAATSPLEPDSGTCSDQQTGQESNPQLSALETDALPVELPVFCVLFVIKVYQLSIVQLRWPGLEPGNTRATTAPLDHLGHQRKRDRGDSNSQSSARQAAALAIMLRSHLFFKEQKNPTIF